MKLYNSMTTHKHENKEKLSSRLKKLFFDFLQTCDLKKACSIKT